MESLCVARNLLCSKPYFDKREDNNNAFLCRDRILKSYEISNRMLLLIMSFLNTFTVFMKKFKYF